MIRFDALTVILEEQVILENLSGELTPGRFHVLVGPSGSGKTTLLRSLAGLTPHMGRVWGPRPLMVFQSFDQLLPWKTLGENVAYALHLAGNREVAQVDRWLSAVDLIDAKDQYPRALSGGMRQRGALARALAFDPSVLLLDEPFGSLDEGLKRRLGEMVRAIQRQTGKTFLFVTHDLEEALRLGDEILVLETKDRLVSLTPEAAANHPFFLGGRR